MEPVAEAFLNVLTIIALIAAVAFIIILLVDLILSITNKKGSIFFRGRNADKDEESKKQGDDSVEISGRPQVLEGDSTQQEPAHQTWDEDAALREQQALLAGEQGLPDEQPASAEKSFTDERHEMIERRKKEFDDFDDFDSLFEESKEEEQPKPAEEKPEEEFNFDDMINEINAESVTKYEASEQEEIVEPVAEPEVAETVEETTAVELPAGAETVTDETETVKTVEESAESTATTAEVTETETTDDEGDGDEEPIEPVVAPKEVVGVYEFFPLEQLEARLKKLQARLKVNERDLRGNRKEYKPLARVKRNLERDQEKLRRREAIIARKKVLLYGVNNYVDIDEEKAKKLSEDLDLLDGLRLSVQHCEEVMEQNKDRFPILEKTNQILVEQNQQIKDDIAEVEAAIAKLKGENAE